MKEKTNLLIEQIEREIDEATKDLKHKSLVGMSGSIGSFYIEAKIDTLNHVLDLINSIFEEEL